MWSRVRSLGAAAALVASVWIGVRCITVVNEIDARPRHSATTRFPGRIHGAGVIDYRSWELELRAYPNEGMGEAIFMDLVNRVWTPESIGLALLALAFAFVGVRKGRMDRLVFALALGWAITMFTLSFRFAAHYQ